MGRTRRAAALTIAVVAIAGCGSDDDPGTAAPAQGASKAGVEHAKAPARSRSCVEQSAAALQRSCGNLDGPRESVDVLCESLFHPALLPDEERDEVAYRHAVKMTRFWIALFRGRPAQDDVIG